MGGGPLGRPGFAVTHPRMGSRDLPLLGGILFEALQWAEAATVGLGRFPTKSETVRLRLGYDRLFGGAFLEPVGRSWHGASTGSGWVGPGRPGSARAGSGRAGSGLPGSGLPGSGRPGSGLPGPGLSGSGLSGSGLSGSG